MADLMQKSKSHVRRVKFSCKPYVSYICKQYDTASACGARNTRHFWEITSVVISKTVRNETQIVDKQTATVRVC